MPKRERKRLPDDRSDILKGSLPKSPKVKELPNYFPLGGFLEAALCSINCDKSNSIGTKACFHTMSNDTLFDGRGRVSES